MSFFLSFHVPAQSQTCTPTSPSTCILYTLFCSPAHCISLKPLICTPASAPRLHIHPQPQHAHASALSCSSPTSMCLPHQQLTLPQLHTPTQPAPHLHTHERPASHHLCTSRSSAVPPIDIHATEAPHLYRLPLLPLRGTCQ